MATRISTYANIAFSDATSSSKTRENWIFRNSFVDVVKVVEASEANPREVAEVEVPDHDEEGFAHEAPLAGRDQGAEEAGDEEQGWGSVTIRGADAGGSLPEGHGRQGPGQGPHRDGLPPQDAGPRQPLGAEPHREPGEAAEGPPAMPGAGTAGQMRGSQGGAGQ